MTLGFTDGSSNLGIGNWNTDYGKWLNLAASYYGNAVGTTTFKGEISKTVSIGVTVDPKQSGIVADVSKTVVVSDNENVRLVFYAL